MASKKTQSIKVELNTFRRLQRIEEAAKKVVAAPQLDMDSEVKSLANLLIADAISVSTDHEST